MTPGRLQQIRNIYERAAALAPALRAAYLADACAGDEELRREVDSLVAAGGQPAAPVAPDAPLKTRPYKPSAANPPPAKPPSTKSSPAESSSRRRARKGGEQTPLEVVPGRTTLGA